MNEENILEDYKEAARFIKGVQVNDEEIIIEYENGNEESYLFEDLKKATIITTDEGPFLDDVFWLMMFKIIVMIPQGVQGEDKLLERMQKLPGFDNEAVIEAMTCSENDAFHVWDREESGQ